MFMNDVGHRRTGQHPLGGGVGKPSFARMDSVGGGVVADIFRDPYSMGEGVVGDIFRDPCAPDSGGG